MAGECSTLFRPSPSFCHWPGVGVMAWSLIRIMAPGSRHIISPAHLPIGVVSLLAMLFASLFHWRQESTRVATGPGCLGIGLACALPAAALFWLFLRCGAILSVGMH